MVKLLNPDFRRAPPKNKPYCVNCQKPIKNIDKSIKITVNWDTWEVMIGGTELIGLDCYKKLEEKQK